MMQATITSNNPDKAFLVSENKIGEMVEKSIGGRNLGEIQNEVRADMKGLSSSVTPRIEDVPDVPSELNGLPSSSVVPQIEGVPDFQSELKAFIDSQSETALAAAQVFEVEPESGDAPLPSPDALQAAVLQSVSPQQWEEVQKFDDPILVMVPVAPLSRFEKAIDFKTHEQPNGENSILLFGFAEENFRLKAKEIKKDLSDADKQRFDAGKVTGYDFVITDGAVEITGGKWDEKTWQKDDKKYVPTNEERITAFEEYFGPKKMGRLETPAFICLQMSKMQKGAPMNPKTYVLLAEQRGWRVTVGAWNADYNSRVGLGCGYLSDCDRATHLPAAVKGHIAR